MMGIARSTPLKLKREKKNKVDIPVSPFDEPATTPLAKLRKARKLVRKMSLKEVPIPCVPDIVPLNLAVPKKLSFVDESSYENSTDSIGRCSTPTDSMCFHCEHFHAEDCCLYVNDTDEDKPRYSRFKRNLEKPSICEKQHNFALLPDAVSGNSTPPHFPSYTPADPMVFEEKIAKQQLRTKTKKQQQIMPPLTPQLSTAATQLPLIYFRQFFYPYSSALQLTVNNLIQPPNTQQQYPHQTQQIYANLPKQQIQPQLTPTMTYHHHQQSQQVPATAIIQPTPLFPTVYHHEYPHFMQQQHYPQQQQSCMTPMTYINAGISYQSQIDLLNHPTLYYQHHHLPQMIPTGFY